MLHASGTAPTPALHAIDLAAERGERPLFRQLDFALHPGEILHVRGRNGAGKTTLLRVLCGLTRPVAGRVCWYGSDVRATDTEFAGSFSYLGHHNGLKDELTAEENVLFGHRLNGGHIALKKVQDLLERIGLGAYTDLPIKVLSQGQKRRVALARVLLQGRPLWILDEPYTALDVQVIDLVLEALQNHLGQGGMVVLTTHQTIEVGVPVKTLNLGAAQC
ncbi:cytochrome c biogenesis heme-transporting ATPase CcmA [Thiorhodospira sibirica]|uniref:cytochrome c biogenesis heme-transporting ATPase CcmA n=1 Tax=Thiorhodospira sibirica TaxID=154347 RepID=UPI00022C2863|nr:cytochrome c biogenesis heme-transporting ATPase CcmA [Thiorhodospira sibirica]